jgi:hypothetical protein
MEPTLLKLTSASKDCSYSEESCRLGCDAVQSNIEKKLRVQSRSVGHVKAELCFLAFSARSLTLMMEAVRFYQTTRQYIPQGNPFLGVLPFSK